MHLGLHLGFIQQALGVSYLPPQLSAPFLFWEGNIHSSAHVVDFPGKQPPPPEVTLGPPLLPASQTTLITLEMPRVLVAVARKQQEVQSIYFLL